MAFYFERVKCCFTVSQAKTASFLFEPAGIWLGKPANQQASEFATGGVADGAHGFCGCEEFRPFAFYLPVCANRG
jgi:hypothetical protein